MLAKLGLREAVSLIITITILALAAGAFIWNKVEEYHGKESYPDDNVAEELLEQQIKMHTGADIDLSPDSPER